MFCSWSLRASASACSLNWLQQELREGSSYLYVVQIYKAQFLLHFCACFPTSTAIVILLLAFAMFCCCCCRIANHYNLQIGSAKLGFPQLSASRIGSWESRSLPTITFSEISICQHHSMSAAQSRHVALNIPRCSHCRSQAVKSIWPILSKYEICKINTIRIICTIHKLRKLCRVLKCPR